MIHGGFWRARYGRKLMRPLAHDLAARGWAAWNIEYRRLGHGAGGGWPTTFADVAAAIDHLDEIRTDAALDLARVVAIGHSAGGHLAAWAAARPRLPEGAPGCDPRVPVTAAVSQAGVVDLELAWDLRLSDGVVGDLLGGGPLEHPLRYRLASPKALVPLGVPVLLDARRPRRHRAAAGERVVRRRRAGRRRRGRAGRAAGRGPLRPHRPGQPALEGGAGMAGVTAREHAEALDAADPLAGFRARFEHAGDGIYLDGNSLGRLPAATRERVLAVARPVVARGSSRAGTTGSTCRCAPATRSARCSAPRPAR